MPNQHDAMWNMKHIATAKRILNRHGNTVEAATEIGTAIGFRVTSSSMRSAFKRMGVPAPGTFLGKTTARIEIADPIERQERKESEAKERRKLDDLVKELREARSRQRFLDALSERSGPPKIIERERSSGVREMTAVVLASDWHVEETVDPESIANRNRYNLEIADQRISRFFNAIAWNAEHQRASGRLAIRDLILWLGGDLMTGYIHDELVESNQLSPVETILWLMPRLRAGLVSLLDRLKLDRIVVPCSYGNHGRSTVKPRISTGAQNSYEWLAYHALARELQDEKRITFEITKSAHQYVEVYGKTIHFHHGDDLKYAGGVGGLGIPLLKAVPVWDEIRRSEVHCLGHFHQLRDYGRAVVNGSLIGYGPYSQRIRASFEEPAQAMFYFDSKRGKTMLTQLWVAEQLVTKTRDGNATKERGTRAA